MQRNGMQRNAMQWNMMEWNVMEWNMMGHDEDETHLGFTTALLYGYLRPGLGRSVMKSTYVANFRPSGSTYKSASRSFLSLSFRDASLKKRT
eukprot:scaffold486_cov254-Pinguiococcus_pyrenoidosus.AAC.10